MNKSVSYAVSVTLTAMLFSLVSASINPAHAAGCQAMSSDSLQAKASAYHPTIQSAASQYGVSASLVKAVITVESCFRRKAHGSLGEKGLMQLMPATARRFNIRNGYNVQQNVHGGTRYLGYLLQRYDGNLQHTVAAYNAGEGRIKLGRRIPNKAYVSKVMQAYGKFAGTRPSVEPVFQKASWKAEKKSAWKSAWKANPTKVTSLPWPDLPIR